MRVIYHFVIPHFLNGTHTNIAEAKFLAERVFFRYDTPRTFFFIMIKWRRYATKVTGNSGDGTVTKGSHQNELREISSFLLFSRINIQVLCFPWYHFISYCIISVDCVLPLILTIRMPKGGSVQKKIRDLERSLRKKVPSRHPHFHNVVIVSHSFIYVCYISDSRWSSYS